MSTRATELSAAIDVVRRGGPPLLASDVSYHKGIDVSHLRPVGVTDDQGIYVVLPLLGKLTGSTDPAQLMEWFFIGCFAVLFAVYPLLFYELFGSVAVALLAPLGVYWKFRFTQHEDVYFISAWCMLLCLPGLMLAYRWWQGRRLRAVALLVVLMLVASFATAIRIQ